MEQRDFLSQQQAAVERMREMNARSAYYTNKNKPQNQQKTPPEPKTAQKNTAPKNDVFSTFNIPFLDSLLSDGDSALILGLLLILLSEKSDKLLLFALIYILL